MQGVHCTSDGPWVIPRLGEERARVGAYAWRNLLDSGATTVNGTDAPVEEVDPTASFHARADRNGYLTLVNLRTDGQVTVLFPEPSMARMEALRSYILDAAFGAFEEDVKGSLEPGKLADVVVLSRNILTVPEDEILEAEVDFTIVGGEVVHRR